MISPRSPAEKAALYATTESFEERRWARTLEVVSVEEPAWRTAWTIEVRSDFSYL